MCSPTRLSGMRSFIFFLMPNPGGASLDHAPLVGKGPGAMATVRIPYFAHSTAKERVIANTPAFAQAEGTT